MGLKKTKKSVPGPLDIDDPNDLLNRQIDAMTRPNPEFRGGGNVWVFYAGSLTSAWDAHVWHPGAATVAVAAVDRALDSRVDWPTLRRIANQITRIDERTTNDEVRQLLGRAIVSRQLQVIRKNLRGGVGKADPVILAQINGTFRTSINFVMLSGWEGGQYLHGYIPTAGKTGIVAGQSGLTIATGYDIGQGGADLLQNAGIDQQTLNKLTPFAGKKFKDKSRAEVLDYVTNTLRVPVPTIAKGQADLLDKESHARHLRAAIRAWNAAKATGVPEFIALPTPWQTVLLSRFFQIGAGANNVGYFRRFWVAATTGEWATAVTLLRTTDPNYSRRYNQEADFLATQLPPAVVKPPPKPKPALPKRPAPA